MTLQKQDPSKRRPQILDDETRDRRDAPAHEDIRAHEDSWVNHFVRRLAALVRTIGNKRDAG